MRRVKDGDLHIGLERRTAELIGTPERQLARLTPGAHEEALLALQSSQIADLTAMMASIGRAQSLDAASRAAAQAQGREQLRRFLTPGAGYQPGTVTMFHN